MNVPEKINPGPWIFTPELKPGEWKMVDDVLHIGKGTDMNVFCFEVSLTKRDRKFLEALHIGL